MTNILQPNYQEFQHTSCALCGLTSVEPKFMFCGKCRVVVYCSKEHQVNHWKRHKRFCKEHVWRKDNPYGVAASGSCRVTSCACKNWYNNDSIAQASINGHNNSQPSSTSSTSRGNGGAVQNQSISSNYPSSNESNESLRANEGNDAAAKSTYAFLNPVFTSNNDIVDDIVYPNNGGSVLLHDEATSLLLLAPKNHALSSFLHVPPPVEDLENHAPAVAHASLMNNKESEFSSSLPTTNNAPSSRSAIFTSSSYGQITTPVNDGGSSIGSATSFADLTLDSTTSSSGSSGGSKYFPANTSSTSSSTSLSDASKTLVNENNVSSVISGIIDNNSQGLSMTNSSATIPFQHRNNMQYISGQPVQTRMWINQVWEQVIEDMNHYGVCVVDNLLGEARGSAVCREVQNMYSKGAFQDGQLVKSKNGQSKSIRGDKITWVDGSEPYCRNISVLIKLLDNIVMGANNRNNNGKMGSYKIKERSKAMVACYPGSGTHYVKHVDNPNDDGRCVTAIYYLNKDWNTQENGGLLRIFPEGWSHQVADIEPLFDRVIFFWSDRRNPHEVQPAYKTRYAITLWYFDSNAKARAKKSAEEDIANSLKSS